jgi:hypothetical protein
VADGGQIHLKRRATGDGFDVIYRASPVAALLVGRDLDEAEAVVASHHARDAIAHRVALARAWAGDEASPARRAAWAMRELAEQARNEAGRAAAHFGRGADAGALVAPVERAERALGRALGSTESTREAMRPDAGALATAVAELGRSFATVVDALPRERADERALPAEAREVVAAARQAPASLLARLDDELPRLATRIEAEPPLPRASEGAGTGTAFTVAGRVTYGLRLVAGCVSAAGCTTPAERLFKPGGVAAELFARFRGDAPALAMVVAALDPSLSWTLAGAVADA